MLSKVRTLGLLGVHGYEVMAECDVSNGLPAFDIVGLGDTAVREARERVRGAMHNSNLTFPVGKVTVNLAPASRKKGGTLYDLPILVGILQAMGQIPPMAEDCAFLGELSMSGELRGVTGVLPMTLCARHNGVKHLFVPAINAVEAANAMDVDPEHHRALRVYPVESVTQLIAHLNGTEKIKFISRPTFHHHRRETVDFNEVKGQYAAKRAMEIAAAGGHNLAMIGPPGAGKSMLAKRMPGIMPMLTQRESLETSIIYSVMGLTDPEQPLTWMPPFRTPHHTISASGMVGGGGTRLRPGEISLAHNGVLFLDELPEFRKDVLEALRQPIEDGQVQITRASGTEVYPSNFMLVCAMNPCKCGWYGYDDRCTCREGEPTKYLRKLSGPLLDRMDLFVRVESLSYEQLKQKTSGDSSAAIYTRVMAARRRQIKRFGKNGPTCNARMTPAQIQQYCLVNPEGHEFLNKAYAFYKLTPRSLDRVLRVSRTIADLDGSEHLEIKHMAEALQYRQYSYMRATP